jgi:integrase
MSLGKQAKIVTERQLSILLAWLTTQRNAERNRLIVLLSFKAGLRAKEIASLKWSMVTDATGNISDVIALTNDASKGKNGGRHIAMNKDIHAQLELLKKEPTDPNDFVVKSERGGGMSAQVIVNMFQDWYKKLGFVGCSSHSGRRTAITHWARKVSLVGGSLRDVQIMAGHAFLTTTSKYIECDGDAQRKLVNLR